MLIGGEFIAIMAYDWHASLLGAHSKMQSTCFCSPLLKIGRMLIYINELAALYSQITMPHDVERLTKSTRTSAALYIACGIDPTKVRTDSIILSLRPLFEPLDSDAHEDWCTHRTVFATGIYLCSVACTGACWAYLVTELCYANQLAEQNDPV